MLLVRRFQISAGLSLQFADDLAQGADGFAVGVVLVNGFQVSALAVYQADTYCGGILSVGVVRGGDKEKVQVVFRVAVEDVQQLLAGRG